jgi:hypothetical protein
VNDKRMEAPYVDGYCILKKYIEKVEKNTWQTESYVV